MPPRIPIQILDTYRPLSLWESFYLRTRWRICPYGRIDSILPDSGKILDFGCGYGLLANYLVFKNPSRIVTGIDLSNKRIRTAKRSVRDRKNISFHCRSIERLGLAQYDAVVMTDVLHHINDTKLKLLLEIISSSLCNKGILAILDVDRKPFWKFCIAYLIDSILNPKDRFYYRSIREIQGLLNEYPFSQRKTCRADQGLPFSDVIYLFERAS